MCDNIKSQLKARKPTKNYKFLPFQYLLFPFNFETAKEKFITKI